MPKLVITNPHLTIGGTSRVAEISQVTLDMQSEDLDGTTFDVNGWNEITAGLKRGTIQFTFRYTTALSGLFTQLWNAFTSSTQQLAYEVRASSAAVGTDNPQMAGTMLVNQMVFGGQVGQIMEQSSSYPMVGAPTFTTS